jgi:type IV pilus assembly protein PilE
MSRQTAPAKGFTLIELMIVLVIIAVLAAFAYPSYNAYVMRSNRAAAQACLAQYANWMERYYTTNLSYDKDSADADNSLKADPPTPVLDCATAQKTGGRYVYTFSIAPSTYTLTATPKGAQAGDTECGTLTLDQAGAQGSVASCWK